MPKDFSRTQRIARQIQRELAELMRDEVKDPRVSMITITDVEVSLDYTHAKVYYTRLSATSEDPETARGLKRVAPFLRSRLAQALKLRVVPELRFAFDTSIDSGMRLSQLIDEAVASDRAKQHQKDGS